MSGEAKPKVDPKLLENPLLKELMAESLAIQHQFAAELVYAKTGKGYLKSAGVPTDEEKKAFRKFCESLDAS